MSSQELSISRPSLAALGWRFFAIGCVAFGGLMALISVVEDVFVRQRGWMDRDDMLEGISLANVLPGPQAVNTVTYVGYRIRGAPGALVSFIGILTPTFVLVTILTFLYFQVAREVSWLEGFFAGLVPAVAAVIFSVVRRLGATAVSSPTTWALALGAAVALVVAPAALKLWVNLGALVAAGVVGVLALQPEADGGSAPVAMPWSKVAPLIALPVALAALYLANPPLTNGGLADLALTFSGLSVMLFGGGYVFIPMIMDVVVTQEAWLTAQEFSDGIAFSQITPGPIMISAAFIGQKVMMSSHGPLWGVIGGLVSTLAIFAPPALLMVGASQALDAIRSHLGVQGALKGIRSAVVGMIVVAGWIILVSALPPLSDSAGQWLRVASPPLGLFIVSLVALVRFQVNVLIVLPLCGVLGAVLL